MGAANEPVRATTEGPGDGSRLPNGGNTRVGQRGSGHLAAFSDRMAAGLIKPAYAARLWANREWRGCIRTSV